MKAATGFGDVTRLLLLSVLLITFTSPEAAPVPAPSPTTISVVDATPPFWKFWTASSGKSDAERVRLFFEIVVAAHPQLFESDVLIERGLTGKSASTNTQAIVAAYLRDVSPYITRMRELSAAIHHKFTTYARDFSIAFPEYAPKSPVYFTVSLFSFDGATRTVSGKTALLFGIDGIARFHARDANLKVLFDHELFHQYHDQIAPELTADDAPLWMSLWEEGLAAYVSQEMNPGSSEADALMSDSLAARAAPMLPALARELLGNFESTDSKEYAAFFFGANGRPDLPPRCGYYVGYQVARQVSAGRPVQQVAALRGPELEKSVRMALERLAQQP